MWSNSWLFYHDIERYISIKKNNKLYDISNCSNTKVHASLYYFNDFWVNLHLVANKSNSNEFLKYLHTCLFDEFFFLSYVFKKVIFDFASRFLLLKLLCFIAVHGVWEEWSPWILCSFTCGRGQRTRTRSCTPPQYGGRPCEGPETHHKPCNIALCPGEPVLHLVSFVFLIFVYGPQYT